MTGERKIRVGSRKSELALIQTRHVISLLQEIHKDIEFETVTMSTLGDKVLDIPLPKIGEKSLFTKELETALSTGCVDFVVHSLKDLPTVLPEGMAIGAVLEREDPRDALVLQKDLKDMTLQTLPKGSTIGTSSLRRAAQISRKYPHLKIEDIRGNLNTRLRKLDELGKFQAIILAVAGLQRMGWEDRVTKVIDPEEIMYAVGQGALAVECRENDSEILKLLESLYDPKTAIQVITERTFLQTLGGGCSAPVAISAKITNIQGSKHNISVTGGVWSLDGKEELTESLEKTIELRKVEKFQSCPYNKQCNNINNKSEDCCLNNMNKSKECCLNPKRSNECCLNGSYEVPRKRLRTESSEKEIPVELLDNDPHKHCPVPIPIGADFMGKCPFFEMSTDNAQHMEVHLASSSSSLDISKCPYFKNGGTSNKDVINGNVLIKEGNSNLFSGLVAHKKLPVAVLEEARDLGKELANKLISKGALDIMAKAQAHIRNS